MEDRPASKGLAGLQALGSKPPSRQGTASVPRTAGAKTPLGTAKGTPKGTPRTPGGTALELNALAQKLIVKLRKRFGEAADNVRAQELITKEVVNFMKHAVNVKEEDIHNLEIRIRSLLAGNTPITNTLTDDKMAQIQGDEWAKIYQYSIAEGNEKEKAEFLAMKERQKQTRESLAAQMKERDAAKKAEHEHDMAYAAQEQAELKAWESQEDARRRLQQEIANKLKEERAAQLSDKKERQQNAIARVRAEEEYMANRMAYDAKTEIEKEEKQRLEAKHALKAYMMENETNKAIKQKEKLDAWEEDLYYRKAWEATLDKQEDERKARLAKMREWQDKTAAYANSGALPDYKKWSDPALAEKYRKEHEAKLDREEVVRKERLKAASQAMVKKLSEQVKEREMTLDQRKREDTAKGQVMLEKAAADEAKEQARRKAVEEVNRRFKTDLDRQMKENVLRKRVQPISDVERAMNRELLEKVEAWKLTGRIDIPAK